MRITSTANPIVRATQALDSPRERRERGLFVVEGVRLVTEAMRSTKQAAYVLYDPGALSNVPSGPSLLPALPDWAERVYEVDARVLRAAGHTEHPGGIVAVLRQPESPPLTALGPGIGVLLDGIADPGNAGTIMRAADAFGAAFVVSMQPSVDLFAPKVVRSAMGAHFRLPIATRVSWGELKDALPNLALIGAAADEGIALTAFRWPAEAGLVIGSEAAGLSADGRAAVEQMVHIPMRSEVESLNAAMAASIMLFHALGTRISAG